MYCGPRFFLFFLVSILAPLAVFSVDDSESVPGTDIATSNESTQIEPDQDLVNQNIKFQLSWSFAILGQGYPTSPSVDFPDVNGIRSTSLTHIPGVGINILISPDIFISPTLELIIDEYIYKTSLGMAFPAVDMTGSDAGGPVASVLGLVVSVPFDFRIPINKTLTLELSPGLSFLPYIPIAVIEDKDSIGIDIIGEYLNKDLKWLYPSTAIQLEFHINKNFDAVARARVLYPLWHAWTEDSLPFYDHMIIDGALVLRFIP